MGLPRRFTARPAARQRHAGQEYGQVPQDPSADIDVEDLARTPYMDTNTYYYVLGQLVIVGAILLTVTGLYIWAFVMEGSNSSTISDEQRRRASLERRLWEKCTPNLGNSKPPVAIKDSGTYILQNPGEVQFPLGWTSVSHQCLWDDPLAPTTRNLTFDGTVDVQDGKSLTAVDAAGLGIRPTFSKPAYLTRWTGPLLYAPVVPLASRCGLSPQEFSIYILLLEDGTPLPCTCRNSVEYCYQYPDPSEVDAVFLNDNKEVP